MDKTDDMAPGEPVPHPGNRALANGCPNPTLYGFEANAVLVIRPQLHGCMGKRRGHVS